MMNEIPLTRDGLRYGLAEAVEELGIQLETPAFWQQNHKYCSTPSMELGDLWLYHNRTAMKSLIAVAGDAFAYINFRPAVTEISAQKAQSHLMNAYASDQAGIRTFLKQAPPYLDAVVQKLFNQGDAQLTPQLLHDAMHAILLLEGVLSKQPVSQTIHA